MDLRSKVGKSRPGLKPYLIFHELLLYRILVSISLEELSTSKSEKKSWKISPTLVNLSFHPFSPLAWKSFIVMRNLDPVVSEVLRKNPPPLPPFYGPFCFRARTTSSK
jgi:hypothetical protein